MQVENVSCHIPNSSFNLVTHEYLKNHFNELLNNKVYDKFKKLFGNINIDSMKEVLPKVNIYNETIAKFVEEINAKYGMTLKFTLLEPCEVDHWAEMLQVAKSNNKEPEPPMSCQVH